MPTHTLCGFLLGGNVNSPFINLLPTQVASFNNKRMSYLGPNQYRGKLQSAHTSASAYNKTLFTSSFPLNYSSSFLKSINKNKTSLESKSLLSPAKISRVSFLPATPSFSFIKCSVDPTQDNLVPNPDGTISVKQSHSGHTNASAKKKMRFNPLGIFFLAVTYFWAVVLFIPMLIVHPFVMLFDPINRRLQDKIAMSWMRITMLSLNIIPQLKNPQNIPIRGEYVVYVANHQSWLDIYSLAFVVRPMKFVSKYEIFFIPIVGWAMKMANHIGLKRGDRRSELNTFKDMVNIVKSGNNLVIFPEGTRSKDGFLKKFRRGAFKAAMLSKKKVVPITISGTREIMPPSALLPLSWPKEPIILEIHPAIETEGKTEEQISQEAFIAIESGLPKRYRESTHE